MSTVLIILLVIALVSLNYWAWVYSKKDFTIVVNVEPIAAVTNGVMPGNTEMMEFLDKKADQPKREVPLPDPAALLKDAPRTSFGSRTQSGD